MNIAVFNTKPVGYVWMSEKARQEILVSLREAYRVSNSDTSFKKLTAITSRLCVTGLTLTHKNYDELCELSPRPPALSVVEPQEVDPKLLPGMRQFGTGQGSRDPDSNVALRQREWFRELFEDEKDFERIMDAAMAVSMEVEPKREPRKDASKADAVLENVMGRIDDLDNNVATLVELTEKRTTLMAEHQKSAINSSKEISSRREAVLKEYLEALVARMETAANRIETIFKRLDDEIPSEQKSLS